MIKTDNMIQTISDFETEGVPVLYFHGAASKRDLGPDDAACDSAGVRLLRHIRPGYEGTEASPGSDLRDVAGDALDAAAEIGCERLVVMGWSGGGPYALAAASLGRSAVLGVGVLASWAPMDPPAPGLPVGVRAFMRLGRWAPRPVLRATMGAAGFRTDGHVDDVRRVARPWGFSPGDAAAHLPVVAWHREADTDVPIEPWRRTDGVDLVSLPGCDHSPSRTMWDEALRWAASLPS